MSPDVYFVVVVLFKNHLFVTIKETFIYNICYIYYMVNIVYLEEETHKKAKVAAAKQNKTLKQYVTELINEETK